MTTCPPVKKGDKVRVPKGAEIHSMHPRRNRYTLTRAQIVTVFFYDEAYEAPWKDFVPAKITWPGTGGYWNETTDWESID